MRYICNTCNSKDSCTYIKNNKERDCIDVQTSDYGYVEAIDKVCQYLKDHIDPKLTIYHNDTWCSLDGFIEKMRNYFDV